MASWESHRHCVGSRTFVVLEHTADQIMVNGISTGIASQWRTVQDTVSGEVVREFKAQAGCYSPAPYNFTEGQQWLEMRFAKPAQHGFADPGYIPKIGDVDTQGFRCTALNGGASNAPWTATWMKRAEAAAQTHYKTTQGGHVLQTWVQQDNMSYANTTWANTNGNIYVNVGNPAGAQVQVQEFGVPPEAEFIDPCMYGGKCHYCSARIDVGSPIWWHRSNKNSRIWCGAHKTRPAATAVSQDHDTEDDMLRDNFTFPYTGAEIAAGLEAQAAQLDAEASAVTRLDPTTLEALFPSKGDREDKIAQVETKIKRLQEKAAKIRTEAKPYAKAGKQSFDLDLEDVAHFGLDADDPAPRKIRKPRAAKEELLVGSAGGAAG